MNKHKHHIIPRYRCKELGIDPDFPENIVEVTRKDHALIHWGYFCDDLEPLFEYVRPSQEIIDLIPRGDNRDVGGAVLNARGEIDKIDMSGENNPMWGVRGENAPNYKHGKLLSYRDNPEIKSVYDKEHYQLNREKRSIYHKEWHQKNREKELQRSREYRAKKKYESTGEGTLEGFLT